jgi:hypothetical protein
MKNDKKEIEAIKKFLTTHIHDESQRLKELKNQVLSLQIQNAFLKE